MSPSCYGGMPIQSKTVFEVFPSILNFTLHCSLKQRYLNDYNLCPHGDSRESLSKAVSAKPFYKYKETFSFLLPSFTPVGLLKLHECYFMQPWGKLKMFHDFVHF